MSLLILAVAGPTPKSAASTPTAVASTPRQDKSNPSRLGALLLFADYTVTASLSALDAFHYYGLPLKKHVEPAKDAARPQVVRGCRRLPEHPRPRRRSGKPPSRREHARAAELFHWDSPGLWAIVAV